MASWTGFSLEKCDFVKTVVFCVVFDGFSWSGGAEIRTKIDKKLSSEGLGGRNFLLETLFADLKWTGGVLGWH